jgi:hypothetical protein
MKLESPIKKKSHVGNVKILFERDKKKHLAGKNNWREKKKLAGEKKTNPYIN